MFDESRDLDDIATWDERPALDRVSVRLSRFLKTSSQTLVVLTAILTVVSQLALTGFAVVRRRSVRWTMAEAGFR
ncbi:hypothetical protein [Salinirarus marinus]|uniref:hypothetical protein n=1 Tax=Salinirarus marinus TaxID=3068310 RepID=UPI003C6C268E